MPTGYTDMIDEHPRLTTAKWVMEGLSRAFGVCVTLRDDSMNLSEKEIEKRLQKEVDDGMSYYREKLKETDETLAKLHKNPKMFWDAEYAATVDRIKKRNAEQIIEKNKTKVRHDQVKQDLIKLRDNTTDEVTRNIAQFGLDQLELVKSETEPWITEIPSLEKFKADKYASLNQDIEYYTKNINEAEERERGRLIAYRTIKAEVTRILGSNTSAEKVKGV